MKSKNLIPEFSTNYIDDASVVITFDIDWAQEDIKQLKRVFFSSLDNVIEIECIIGADRENIRFSWQDTTFTLNFECCSQSCWIDTDSSENIGDLINLTNELVK